MSNVNNIKKYWGRVKISDKNGKQALADTNTYMRISISPCEYPHAHTYVYLLLLISMLWHRQAIFKSKGDKLFSTAECRIWTRGPRHQIASRLNARWQTYWAIEDQAKNLNSTARPYDQRAFSPLDPTVSSLSHLALAICIFVVVNFDASDMQIERRQVVFSTMKMNCTSKYARLLLKFVRYPGENVYLHVTACIPFTSCLIILVSLRKK